MADITVYREQKDLEKMFAKPEYVFKEGELVVRNGRIVKLTQGATQVVRPDYDRAIEQVLEPYFDRFHTVQMENFKLHDEEILDQGRGRIVVHSCRPRATV